MHLSKLAFAYNSTKHKSTGFSPFYLMFGRESILPIDYMFQMDSHVLGIQNRSHKKFVDDWGKSMQEAFKIANEHINKSTAYNKKHYDKKVKENEIVVGDRVLIRNVRDKGGTGKLKSYWEPNIFEVLKRDENLPVYSLQNMNNKRDRRVLHRNLLMKSNDIPLELFEKEEVKKTNVTNKKQKTQNERNAKEDDEEFNIQIIYPTTEVGGEGEIEKTILQNDENDASDSTVDAVPDIVVDETEDEGGDNLMVEHFGGSRSEEDFEGFPEEEISQTDASDEKPNSDIEIEERDEKESDDDDDERKSTENTRRCSSRNRQRKQMFTYHKMGGNPILE